jgi:glycosyltransferase involved in cell wall biosynthesis
MIWKRPFRRIFQERGQVADQGGKQMIKDISVVIPVYNEEANIPELYHRLTLVLKSLGLSYEIVMVDDGSRDSSFEKMKELSRADQSVSSIHPKFRAAPRDRGRLESD